MNLSVIIPAHNEEKVILKTLKAVGASVETIVVCNACSDKTYNLAKNHATKVFNLKERGVSLARNFGARQASGERLVFLDADIVISKDTLKKIDESKLDYGTTWVRANSPKFYDSIVMFLKNGYHFFHRSTGIIFCNRDIFEKVNGFDENLTKREDCKFLREAKHYGKYGIVNTFVYNNMRRFHQFGYWNLAWYWIRENIKPSDEPYPIIR